MAATRDGRDTEKLVEGWLHRLSPKEVKKRGLTQASDAWSHKYYVLCRVKESVHLDFFKKPPKKDEQTKDSLHLASYQVNKKTDANKVKRYVCELLVNEAPSYYAFDTEERRDSFVFFLQTQKRLQDDITGTTFSVKPEDSADQRKIGARGSVCYLHVCSAGLTLALQVSRSIVAQWPLKCIRWYSSSDKGQFVFEAGRRAPMGEGRYSFDTHATQDTQLYDLLDKYVMDANNLWQSHSSDEFIEKKIFEDYCSLRLLALGFADMVFSRHLMRLSTCNFDDLAVPPSVLPLAADVPVSSQSPETAAKSHRSMSASGELAGLGAQTGPPAAASAQGSEVMSQNATNWAKVAVLEAHSKHGDSPGAIGKIKENYMDMASVARTKSSRGTSMAASPGVSAGGSPIMSSPTKGGDMEFVATTYPALVGSPPKRYVRAPAEGNVALSVALPEAYENTAESRGDGFRESVVTNATSGATAAACAAAREDMSALTLDAEACAASSCRRKGPDVRQGSRSVASDYLYEPVDSEDDEEAGGGAAPLWGGRSAGAEHEGSSKDAYEQVTDVELSGQQQQGSEAAELASLGRPPPVPTAPRPPPAAAAVDTAGHPGADGSGQKAQPAPVALKKRDLATADGLHSGIRASPASVVFTKVKKPASLAAEMPREAGPTAGNGKGASFV